MKPFRTALLEGTNRDPQNDRVAWLGSFEVEREWKNKQTIGLPEFISQANEHHFLSELALLLSDPEDLVLLNQEPDPDFLTYLSSYDWQVPHIAVRDQNGERNESLTRMFLEGEGMPAAVARWFQEGSSILMPHGTSEWEEKLAAKWGIPLGTPPLSVTHRVNSKLFSRELCSKHCIPQTNGLTVRSLDELEWAFRQLSPHLSQGPLVLKEGMGVSGKGLQKIESKARFQQLIRMMRHMEVKRGTDRTELVLEQWIPKSQDLNIHFIVGADGRVDRMEILTALVNNGSHLGHLHPHTLSPASKEALISYVTVLGQALHREGYYGVAGIDAMVSDDGTLYPCVEINARMNMSTYHTRILHEWVPQGKCALIRSFSFQKPSPLPFRQLQSLLEEQLFTLSSGKGVIICSFAPVHIGDKSGRPASRGKLYTLLIGDTAEECMQLQQFCEQQLQQLAGNPTNRF